MPPSSRIPPLLQPHVRLPHDDSILLLTSTLGASANWLITRILCDALRSSSKGGGGLEADNEEGVDVLLVSWMREYEFWKQEARKGAGVDLERGRREGRVGFVDGLSGLFLEPEDMAGTKGAEMEKRPAHSLPVRGSPSGRLGAVLARGLSPAPSQASATSAVPATVRQNAQSTTLPSTSSRGGLYTLQSPDLAHLKSTITTALSHFTNTAHTRKTLLILDNPDILLAASPDITHSSLTSLILTLHALPSISHVLVHLQADTPLLGTNIPPQPIEVAQRNLLVKIAHMSRRVLGVRVLDTGVARDVSGVLRATENEGVLVGLGVRDREEGEEEAKGKEMLYKVNGDGSVKVFERGAGGEG
ncbi:hypothetical protein CC80DRAFT_468436 [Byssothecium circinans]|uniref:Elongator complex protein 5 n=1 Tax=Byssothecium circinans TaxID=147558 RepID=A0A6A5U4H1_9PLEO|nr:hypothetical protein CC80DRAFT_468436 [Byssothecium circinans]